MSDNLQDLIARSLGVVPQAPAATAYTPSPKKLGAVPPKPEPQYEYRISVSRQEYGSVYITSTSTDSAFDEATADDIQWDDCGDIDWDASEVEQTSYTPENQSEIDDWEASYGTKYTDDGEPKCSDCGYEYAVNDLKLNPTDDNEWFCTDCYAENV